VASIGLAFDYADTQAANADQGGLFDFAFDDEQSHAASTREPDLVAAEPWSIKERLGFEKVALGFYLSGHLFDQSADEVRRIARRRNADLVDSREPQLPASSATCAWSTASAAAWRSSSSTTRPRPSRRWPTRSCSTPTATCSRTTS
jgi:DNA polymerase III alpha subunit